MLAILQELGIIPSFSCPSVSNDNSYSESLFRTLKYRPEYPEQPFSDLGSARIWGGLDLLMGTIMSIYIVRLSS